MIVDGVFPLVNYFGNFAIEEFGLPVIMHHYITELNYAIEAEAPFAGFNLLKPILDKDLGIYQIGLEKKDLPTTNEILPGFEPNNHTFQMYVSEAMVADKLIGEPWVFMHDDKLWF